MRCAKPPTPHTTKATVRCGSSLSPPVTSLAPALLKDLVAEPTSRSADSNQQLCCTSKSPRLQAGGFLFRVPGPCDQFMEKPRQVSSPGPFVSIDEQVSAVAYMPIVTHATARRHVRMLGLILRRVRDHHFRGEQQTGHRSSVLQRQARDL